MKRNILIPLVIILLAACNKSNTQDKPQIPGNALERLDQLYTKNQFRDALALCDSMLLDEAYRVDSLPADENNRRYIVVMRQRILILGYLNRQAEAVSDMETLAHFCTNNPDDEENFYSSVAAQMNVKIGRTLIGMGQTIEGLAAIDKGINAMRNKKSKNARLATVNFMMDKAKALDELQRRDVAIAQAKEALLRIEHLREAYAESFANNNDMDVLQFCDFYEGSFNSFLANVYRGRAERGELLANDSIRICLRQALSIPRFRDDPNSDDMLIGVYCHLDMQTEFERAYRQVEQTFAHDTIAHFYIDVQQYAARMAQKQGDTRRALAIMQRMARLQSQHMKADDMKRVAEAANAYEVAEMQRTQNEMEVSRLKWIIMAVCMGFLALAVCITLFYHYRRNRRTYHRYKAIIDTHDTNDVIIRALQMDPDTPIDYLLTLTGDAQPEQLERHFALINGLSLDDFRSRLRQDEVKEDDSLNRVSMAVVPDRDTFLQKLDRVLLADDRIFSDTLSRKDIANEMEMPMKHIFYLLKEYTGCTLAAYITQKRLERAAHLLLTTQTKVGLICRASGFNSVATFYRLFTKHYGCPPAEYRAES